MRGRCKCTPTPAAAAAALSPEGNLFARWDGLRCAGEHAFSARRAGASNESAAAPRARSDRAVRAARRAHPVELLQLFRHRGPDHELRTSRRRCSPAAFARDDSRVRGLERRAQRIVPGKRLAEERRAEIGRIPVAFAAISGVVSRRRQHERRLALQRRRRTRPHDTPTRRRSATGCRLRRAACAAPTGQSGQGRAAASRPRARRRALQAPRGTASRRPRRGLMAAAISFSVSRRLVTVAIGVSSSVSGLFCSMIERPRVSQRSSIARCAAATSARHARRARHPRRRRSRGRPRLRARPRDSTARRRAATAAPPSPARTRRWDSGRRRPRLPRATTAPTASTREPAGPAPPTAARRRSPAASDGAFAGASATATTRTNNTNVHTRSARSNDASGPIRRCGKRRNNARQRMRDLNHRIGGEREHRNRQRQRRLAEDERQQRRAEKKHPGREELAREAGPGELRVRPEANPIGADVEQRRQDEQQQQLARRRSGTRAATPAGTARGVRRRQGCARVGRVRGSSQGRESRDRRAARHSGPDHATAPACAAIYALTRATSAATTSQR